MIQMLAPSDVNVLSHTLSLSFSPFQFLPSGTSSAVAADGHLKHLWLAGKLDAAGKAHDHLTLTDRYSSSRKPPAANGVGAAKAHRLLLALGC